MTQLKRITIHDVALAAGVSVSTVSLVLNGKGRISEATGLRVNHVAEKLGFIPSRQACALRTGQSGVIGLIARDLYHPFYAGLIAGISETLAEQGIGLLLTRDDMHSVKNLVARGVDGVVIAADHLTQSLCQQFGSSQDLPLVCVARAHYPGVPELIRPDNMQAAQLLTEHLISRGHQCIGWLGGDSSSLIRAERLGGYCATLLQYGLPFHHEWIMECQSNPRQAAQAIEQLLTDNPAITAVICYDNQVALGSWFALSKLGWHTSTGGLDSYFDHAVALAAFSDLPAVRLETIAVSWALIPCDQIGRSVAHRLVQFVDQPSRYSSQGASSYSSNSSANNNPLFSAQLFSAQLLVQK